MSLTPSAPRCPQQRREGGPKGQVPWVLSVGGATAPSTACSGPPGRWQEALGTRKKGGREASEAKRGWRGGEKTPVGRKDGEGDRKGGCLHLDWGPMRGAQALPPRSSCCPAPACGSCGAGTLAHLPCGWRGEPQVGPLPAKVRFVSCNGVARRMLAVKGPRSPQLPAGSSGTEARASRPSQAGPAYPFVCTGKLRLRQSVACRALRGRHRPEPLMLRAEGRRAGQGDRAAECGEGAGWAPGSCAETDSSVRQGVEWLRALGGRVWRPRDGPRRRAVRGTLGCRENPVTPPGPGQDESGEGWPRRRPVPAQPRVVECAGAWPRGRSGGCQAAPACLGRDGLPWRAGQRQESLGWARRRGGGC